MAMAMINNTMLLQMAKACALPQFLSSETWNDTNLV